MKYLNKLFSWMGEDGMAHVILSAFICAILNLFLPWWLAGSMTLLTGIAKEVYDSTGKGYAEWKDIGCNLIGILIGIL